MPSRNVDSRPLTWRISQHRRVQTLPDPWAIVTFTWMRSAADNLGRIEGDPDLMASQLLPLRPDIDGDRMAELLQMMHDGGVAFWYEVDGNLYLQIPPDLWFDLDQKVVGNMKRDSDFPDPPEAEFESWLTRRNTSVRVHPRSNTYKHVSEADDQTEHVPRREGKGREGMGGDEKGRTSSGSVEPAPIPPIPDGRAEIASTTEAQPKAPVPALLEVAAAKAAEMQPERRSPRRQPQPQPEVDGQEKGKAWSPEAGRLAKKLYDWLDARGARPAMDKSKFFQQQAAKAEQALRSGRTELELFACLDWAFTHRFWSTRIRDFGQVSIEVWTQFAREVVYAGNGGRQQAAGESVGTGPGARPAAQYDRLSE